MLQYTKKMFTGNFLHEISKLKFDCPGQAEHKILQAILSHWFLKLPKCIFCLLWPHFCKGYFQKTVCFSLKSVICFPGVYIW